MKNGKKSIWKTLAGLAVAGAAVGSAIAYVKKCKEVNDLSEEDFDDLFDEEDSADCSCEKQVERTYTTLPTEDSVAAAEEDKAEAEVAEEYTETADVAEEETAEE